MATPTAVSFCKATSKRGNYFITVTEESGELSSPNFKPDAILVRSWSNFTGAEHCFLVMLNSDTICKARYDLATSVITAGRPIGNDFLGETLKESILSDVARFVK